MLKHAAKEILTIQGADAIWELQEGFLDVPFIWVFKTEEQSVHQAETAGRGWGQGRGQEEAAHRWTGPGVPLGVCPAWSSDLALLLCSPHHCPPRKSFCKHLKVIIPNTLLSGFTHHTTSCR